MVSRTSLRLPTLTAFCLFTSACGPDTPASDLCPAGTSEYTIEARYRLTRYCLDGAGLAHGPYVELYVEDVNIDEGGGTRIADVPPRVEGAFVHGAPDGVWTYRFPLPHIGTTLSPTPPPATDAIQYLQGFADGLEHGAFAEYAEDGVTLAEQFYDHGRRCDTWRTYQSGNVLTEVAFVDCEDLPPLTPVNPEPQVEPDWDGESCPAGTDRVASTGDVTEIACLRDGLRDGPYRIDAPSEVTVGHYKKGLRDGYWRVWQGGRLGSESQFSDDLRDGVQLRFYPNGVRAEEMTWVKGLREGKATTRHLDGSVRERGDYRDDLREGLWETLSSSGATIATVTYVAGRREGAFTSAYDDGAPECEGTYESDLRAGTWTCYHLHGEMLSRGDYRDGLREGPWNFYEPNAALDAEGRYEGGAPVGLWKIYFDSLDGRVVSAGSYVDGVRDGLWETRWVDDDALMMSMTYVVGTLHGPFEQRFHDGTLNEQGDYVAGEPHGRWKRYYPNGQLGVDGGYFYGVRQGPWDEWWDNGQKSFDGVYNQGYLKAGAQAWDRNGNPIPAGDG